MKVEINVKDEINPMLLYWVQSNERYFRALAKSTGWWYQKSIKEDIVKGHAGDVEYKPRWEWGLRRKLDPKAPRVWYGRLRNAIGYEYDNGNVRIGWVSPTSAKYGDKQEEGYRKFVTERMRRYFASRGIYLKSRVSSLNTPSRPIYDPMAYSLSPKIAPYVNNKIKDYIENGITKGKKNRREYKVY